MVGDVSASAAEGIAHIHPLTHCALVFVTMASSVSQQLWQFILAWLFLVSSRPRVCYGDGDRGNMPDLGYPEPDWYPISQGKSDNPAIVLNKQVQTWGTIEPGDKGTSVCKWSAPSGNSQPGDRGSCKTDISWMIASANLRSSLFDDPAFNYILRFQLYGACYRSTQARLSSLHTLVLACDVLQVG